MQSRNFPIWVYAKDLSKYTLPEPILGGFEGAGLREYRRHKFKSKTPISEVLGQESPPGQGLF